MSSQRHPPRPFWQHAVALLTLLLVLIPVIGTDSAFVTDEAFVVIQLDTIEHQGRWTLPHPVPEVDPTGKAFPLHGASRYEDGYTLYGKHPLLIYLYLPIHRAFGLAGLVALSALGTWAAALGAARLAQRIRPGAAVAALWLVGAGSPLFFDAYVIHAHTIAAAVATGAVLLAVRAIDEDRAACGLGVVGALLITGLLRTEGVLFAGAVGATLGLFGVARRRLWIVLCGGAAMAAGAAAVLIDRAWAGAVAGSTAVSLGTYGGGTTSFLAGRRRSLSVTMLQPGYRGGTLPELLTLTGAVLLIGGVAVLRRRPQDEGALLLPAAGAALLVVRAGLQWGPIPGLLVAFCVGIAGLVLLHDDVARAMATRLLATVGAVFGLAVVATQYPIGGHTEWGGRYFALAVPLLGAIAAAALADRFAGWPPLIARTVRTSLVASAVGLGLLALLSLHGAHERNRERIDGVLAAAHALPVQSGEPPIVVTEDDQVPRLARGRYDQVRFLRVPPQDVDAYLRRLARLGVEDLLLVAVDPTESLRQVPPDYERVGPVRPHKLQWWGEGGLVHLRLVDTG